MAEPQHAAILGLAPPGRHGPEPLRDDAARLKTTLRPAPVLRNDPERLAGLGGLRLGGRLAGDLFHDVERKGDGDGPGLVVVSDHERRCVAGVRPERSSSG
jgi:hypothetical protein